ncbi:MAG TPA: acyl-CoA thioesterase, partial [Ignavibacteria bacterium]|nr:acyl-CoA thioesterase [Ignavibacteria bacterium]
ISILNLKDFKHTVSIRVRTFDVDSQGIVHNMNYFKYYEVGRVEYRRNFGYKINKTGVFDDGLKVVVVRNEVDYISFAYLDDILNVHTRISWIKNSSFCFEQIITNQNNETVISRANGILVNLDSFNRPETLKEKFVNEIKSFENNLKILKND